MTGYLYSEQEPKERCPYCGTLCMADFCDVGVGYTQVGPYWCGNCKASQISPAQYSDADLAPGIFPIVLRDGRELTRDEARTGWYAPESEPDTLANVDGEGRHIRYFEADTLYRLKCGVTPRYDRDGKMIKKGKEQ